MEDNHLLLMKVLKVHYKNRLQILDDALTVIKEYSNKPETAYKEYNATCTTLQGMLNDLPEDILHYFLTMVPLPKNRHNFIPLKEENANINAILILYLKKQIPPIPTAKQEVKTEVDTQVKEVVPEVKEVAPEVKEIVPEVKEVAPEVKEVAKSRPGTSRKKNKDVPPPVKRTISRSRKRGPKKGCKKLIDICAEYVTKNHPNLNKNYQNLKNEAWKMIYSEQYKGDTLQAIYEVVRDLNKKIKWLRLLEAEEITDEIIREEYGNSLIFIKERHLERVLTDDLLVDSSELSDTIKNFMRK